MLRQATFTPADALIFKFLYEGFLLGATLSPTQKRTVEVKRRERTIIRALNSISTPAIDAAGQPVKNPQTGEPMRTMLEEGGVIKLYQMELELLVEYVESVPWLVTNIPAAFDAADWLRASETVREGQ